MGGAAQATYKLHRQLLLSGVESRLYVRYISSSRPLEVYELQRTRGLYEDKIKPRLKNRKYAGLKKQYQLASHIPFSWNTLLPEYPLQEDFIQNADIVGVYWIGEFMNPENLRRLTQPVVWRLSDIWPFSGGCHYPGECKAYQTQCGNCPILKSNQEYDFSRKMVERKAEAWKDLNLTIAAPSKWIGEMAGNSSLFKHCNIEIIKTGVDEAQFKPLDKVEIKKAFNVAPDSVVILFGADSAADPRKGMSWLLKALEQVKKNYSGEITLAIFGRNYDAQFDTLGLKILNLGYVTETFLPFIYNLADVFVAPSVEENLPNTVLEAMACEIPCVTFHTGGLPDLIEHGLNGWMAENRNYQELAEGILFSLKNQSVLGTAARTTILGSFTQKHQTQSYLELYNRILQ